MTVVISLVVVAIAVASGSLAIAIAIARRDGAEAARAEMFRGRS
jgi:hypothetical protein